MNEAHELVGVRAILLAVAQEEVGIEGIPDSPSGVVAGQRGVKVVAELVLVVDGRRVGLMAVHKLQLAKAVAPTVDLEHLGREHVGIDHDGQHGDVVDPGEGEILVHGAVGLREEAPRHWDDEEVHTVEAGEADVGRQVLVHALGVVDGAVVRPEQVVADQRKRVGEVVGVAGEVHARLLADRDVVLGAHAQRIHGELRSLSACKTCR